MTNGLEKGYTKLSNEILENINNRFSKREILILLYVFRHGYGYHKEQSACDKNVRNIVLYTGIDKSHVNSTLKLLEKKKVITVENGKILFNRHACQWKKAKTASIEPRPKQPQNEAKSAPDRGQNGLNEADSYLIDSDLQAPKENLKKKEIPIPPKNGGSSPSNSPSEELDQIINYLNETTGKSFRHSAKATMRLIEARLNEGYTIEDFKTVIEVKSEQWKGDAKMDGYLRPQTLFSNKFESYLQESNRVAKTQTAFGFGDGDTGLRGFGS